MVKNSKEEKEMKSEVHQSSTETTTFVTNIIHGYNIINVLGKKQR